MWLYAKHGFLSIILPRDTNKEGNLLVRARISGDIEHYFPEAKVIKTPNGDYLYRALVPKHRVREVLGNTVENIDYTNFKASVKDDRRHLTYSDVWFEMQQLQDMISEDEERDQCRKKA